MVIAVSWYLRFGLSYRDVEELLAERGVEVDHVTSYRWVLRFRLLPADAARPCRHVVGECRRVDETYLKVTGQWRYVYRAIDQFGQVIDVLVSARRDVRPAGSRFNAVTSQRAVEAAMTILDFAAAQPVPSSRWIERWRLRRPYNDTVIALRQARTRVRLQIP